MTNGQWQFGFYFAQPLWLLVGLIPIPIIWWCWRWIKKLSMPKRIGAIAGLVFMDMSFSFKMAQLKLLINEQWQFGFYFAQPLWLLAGLIAVPIVWWGWRSTRAFGKAKRILVIALRAICVLLLAAIAAHPTLTMAGKSMTVIVVFDRSLSIPAGRQENAMKYLSSVASARPPEDRLAFIDVAEDAYIARLPCGDVEVPRRNTSITGDQSRLADGIQLALAIAPPDTANRIVLVSDGNETSGDLAEAARAAAANRIPIDIVPIRYNYDREVVFRWLVLPPRASSNQTVAVRMVLNSTDTARGTIYLTLNNQGVMLDPAGGQAGAHVVLKPGTNVKTVSVPVGTRGKYEFEATFVPDKPTDEDRAKGIDAFDRLEQNNRASGMTFVAGPGHVLIVDSLDPSDDEPEAHKRPGLAMELALARASIDARRTPASGLPGRLADLLDTDAIILVNLPTTKVSMLQQEMLCRYVTEMGGGLVMVGGPDSFGAGGWIGSPTARVIPVDMDPPQRKQMPKGALALIMHACEMPDGNYWGKETAKAAVNALSREDMAGVLEYGWGGGKANWVHKLAPVGDRKKIIAAINAMNMGDMPDFDTPMKAAYDALIAANAGQRHIIIISDGDPGFSDKSLLDKMKKARITCSGVVVYPHDPSGGQTLVNIAKATGGQHYVVSDPKKLPQIFVKEAMVVSRSLISEEKFAPAVKDGLSETIRGLGRPLPALDGYIVTTPKGGLDQVVLAHPGGDGDPILATGQQGLGRSVAFTSSADSRWGTNWLAWGGFDRFWEQTVRWASKSAQGTDCEINADISGRSISLVVEAVESQGRQPQFSSMVAQVIAPDMTTAEMPLAQIGPGEYRCEFQARAGGSHLVNVRYVKAGQDSAKPGKADTVQAVVNVPFAPEYDSLSTNESLLADVARRTGGRTLPPDAQVNPRKVKLFNHDDAAYPKIAQPLTLPLFIAFLAMFLLDVAARRIAVNWAAVRRRMAGAIKSLRPARSKDATVEKLKARRRKVQDMFTAKGSGQAAAGQAAQDQTGRKQDVSGKRYEAAGETEELKVGEAKPKLAGQPKIPVSPPPDQAKKPPSHLDRLLQAKKKARGDK
ncbi:MAG: VWA domain-containing protein [Planctomycetes bacterium]|nr:VWA domain-containing protein [Planctomycetota bacterium]